MPLLTQLLNELSFTALSHQTVIVLNKARKGDPITFDKF
jgi:hypothetical protein